MPDSAQPTSTQPLIVLYDGSCGFCDRSVQFILARDPNRRFRFAALQSPVAKELMLKHELDAEQLDSVILIEGDKAYTRSTAALRIVLELADPWPLLGALIYVPAELRDAAYDYVARHRKTWFKAPDACKVPTAEEQEQFLA